MSENSTSAFLRSNLKAVWLMIAALSLAMPVFVPSFTSLNPFADVIGTASTLMFVLSFPLSLLAAPVAFVIDLSFGVSPQTIGGRYVNVCVMFGLGAVQWFVIVPRLWSAFATRPYPRNEMELRATDQLDSSENFEAAECDESTPLEKILKDQV